MANKRNRIVIPISDASALTIIVDFYVLAPPEDRDCEGMRRDFVDGDLPIKSKRARQIALAMLESPDKMLEPECPFEPGSPEHSAWSMVQNALRAYEAEVRWQKTHKPTPISEWYEPYTFLPHYNC